MVEAHPVVTTRAGPASPRTSSPSATPPSSCTTAGWASSGHRANILSGGLFEFGAGIAVGAGNFGPIAFATEDFGTRVPAVAALPAGDPGGRRAATHRDEPRAQPSGELLRLRWRRRSPCARWSATRASSCRCGPAARSTAPGPRARSFTGQGCVPVVFEAITEDGARQRFPAAGAILVAAGGAVCEQRSAAAPTQDCGGPAAPAPTPDPDPAPTPGDDPAQVTLSKMRVVLAPGARNASKGQVTIVATLPRLAGFDPTGVPIDLAIGFPAGDWTRTLPAPVSRHALSRRPTRRAACTGRRTTAMAPG